MATRGRGGRTRRRTPTPAPVSVRRVPWSPAEDDKLKGLVETRGRKGEIDWDRVALALRTKRTGKAVQARAATLELVERSDRGKRGHGWDKEARQQGDKNTDRPAKKAAVSPAAAGYDSAVTSPAVDTVSPPPRAAAVTAAHELEEQLLAESKDEAGDALADGLIHEADIRMSWACYYLTVLGAPPESEWDGVGAQSR